MSAKSGTSDALAVLHSIATEYQSCAFTHRLGDASAGSSRNQLTQLICAVPSNAPVTISPLQIALRSGALVRLVCEGISLSLQMLTAWRAAQRRSTRSASEADARGDLWSVRAAMYGMLSGRAVPEERKTHESLLAALTKCATELGAVRPSVPEPIAVIVNRALMFDVSARQGPRAC